jgi:hypothetical protein
VADARAGAVMRIKVQAETAVIEAGAAEIVTVIAIIAMEIVTATATTTTATTTINCRQRVTSGWGRTK